MPQILLKLIEQCQSEDVGMSALADLVAKDPGIACKVLSVANSSAYHRTGRKTGLEQSLTALGADMIKTLVINESVFQVFNGFAQPNGADLRAFWKHSLSAAVVAQDIAERCAYPNVEEAYLAGLLHDVGRLALLATAAKDCAFVFFARDDENLCAVEQSLLNMTHTAAGALLAERWNLDSFLSDSVLYHHDPLARVAGAHPLVRIVMLAHRLSLYDEVDDAVEEAAALCGIEPSELERISQASHTKVQKFADLLGIDLSGADDLIVSTDGWEIAGLIAGNGEAGTPAMPPGQDSGAAKVHDSAQKLLAEEVRGVVLNAGIGRAFSRTETGTAGLIETIARSARILFDLEDAVIFRTNPAGSALVGVAVGEHRQRLTEFVIALDGEGALVEAARDGKVAFVSQAAQAQTIAEEQLLRLLDSNCLVCIPLRTGQRGQGLLIGGLAASQVPALQARERFLKSFGEQAAASITARAGQHGDAVEAGRGGADEYREASRRVVHEANNSLSIIKNYLGVLDGKLGKHDLALNELSILHGEIDRVGQIIKGLSDPQSAPADGVAEVNRVLHEVTQLYRETGTGGAPLQVLAQTGEAPCAVDISVAALKQILVNLVKNAVEAMPAGGEIRLVNNGNVNRDGRLYSEVCVRDNGPGIAPETLEHLFSPLASAKGGEHQGLGLNIVHGLVKQAGGLITCRSSASGTAFEILLPVHKRH